MSGLLARWRRSRRIGIGLIVRKLALRLWSTRIAVMVAAETAPRPHEEPRIQLSYALMPSETLDPSELEVGSTHGADVLYIDGLIRMYQHGPGDAIVARAPDRRFIAVALLSYAERHEALEAAAPGLHQRIGPDECWTEAHYVMPAYRNQRVMAGLLARERDALRERGVRRMLAIIDSANGASLRAFARAGYETTGTVRVDQYRFNRYTSRFLPIDERTRARWERAKT